jgi:pimeloyl-ACP methyl ester carboxylesterase
LTDELPIVLLHGSATGYYSWAAVRTGLEAHGAMVMVPDMLRYGRSPTPSVWRASKLWVKRKALYQRKALELPLDRR